MSNKDFLNMPAPPNYVPGLGRGATGFTTRSDIGPAREGAIIDASLIKSGAINSGDKTTDNDNENDDNEDERFRDIENDVGLFTGNNYDKDDEEADEIYKQVELKMESRRRAQREARENKEQEEYEKKNPKISSQFVDLKRGLASITNEEWLSIPNVGDLTGRNRRNRLKSRENQRFYAVPDSLLASAANSNAIDFAIQSSTNDDRGDNSTDNDTKSSTKSSSNADIRTMAFARDMILGMTLDKVISNSSKDSAIGSTNIDPKGYLTSMAANNNQNSLTGGATLGDIKKTRLLLKSIIDTNPDHAPGWIAAARLEETDRKLITARKLLAEGCEHCPRNEDIWLERIRLHEQLPENAKTIASKAVKFLPKSVKLWTAAIDLEHETLQKKIILRRALEEIPQSVSLWKQLVNLEDDENSARALLAKAVELVPLSTDLWLALAHLETYKNARKVLNKARKSIPTSYEIWIAAGQLEETASNTDNIPKLIKVGKKELQKAGLTLQREQWIAEAKKSESNGFPKTASAIIQASISDSLDPEDRERIWLEDAKFAIGDGHFDVARAIYSYSLSIIPDSLPLWRAYMDLEKYHGTNESLMEVLKKSVETVPEIEVLWLMYAKEKWNRNDVDGARKILTKAFNIHPGSEDIWLAAAKLEASNANPSRARDLLRQARDMVDTERVWIKSIVLERQNNNKESALDLLNEGLSKYSRCPKLWMMKGQIYIGMHDIANARDAYLTGSKMCPKSVPIWILLSRLESSQGNLAYARSILDRAALKNPANADIWTERIRLEKTAKEFQQARLLTTEALKECPTSGKLWAESISLESRTSLKDKLTDAIKKSENDPLVLLEAAKFFWSKRSLKGATAWFERAISKDPDNGDIWAWYYKYLQKYGEPNEVEELISRFLIADPHHGEIWPTITKSMKYTDMKPEELLHIASADLKLTF